MAERHDAIRQRMTATIAARPDSVIVRSTFAPARRDTVVFEVTRSAGQGSGGFSRRQRTGEFRTQVMPVVDRFVGTRSEKIPAAYLLDAQWSEIVERLVRLGVVVERIDEPWTGNSRRFTVDSINVQQRPFEGHRIVRLAGERKDAQPDSLAAGGYVISPDRRQCTVAASW